jgi:hypothetical protein
LHLNTPYENEYNGYDQKIINDSSKRWFFTGYKNSVKDHNNDILSAPLYQQAFRWFREKHGLDYEITSAGKKGEYHSFVHGYVYGNNGSSPSVFSYEEAELECLKKLIEIVKEK